MVSCMVGLAIMSMVITLDRRPSASAAKTKPESMVRRRVNLPALFAVVEMMSPLAKSVAGAMSPRKMYAASMRVTAAPGAAVPVIVTGPYPVVVAGPVSVGVVAAWAGEAPSRAAPRPITVAEASAANRTRPIGRVERACICGLLRRGPGVIVEA